MSEFTFKRFISKELTSNLKNDSPLGFAQKAYQFRDRPTIGCDGKLYKSIKWGRKYKWIKLSSSPKLTRYNQSQKEIDIDRINCINGGVIKEFGVSIMKNTRDFMEGRCIFLFISILITLDFNRITEKYDNNVPLAIFTICDGHGGYKTAKYVITHIHEVNQLDNNFLIPYTVICKISILPKKNCSKIMILYLMG